MGTPEKYLNLGCGSRYHHDWINIDFVSTTEIVRGYNLLQGIPVPDNSVEVVYHSHLLEHFNRKDAKKFISECYRVLQPGGIIRIAVPDLEQLAFLYIKLLKESRSHLRMSEENYNWIMLELFDQMVRNNSGGEMFEYYITNEIINEEFIRKRCGVYADILIEKGKEIYEKRNETNKRIKKNIQLLKLLKKALNIKMVAKKIILSSEEKKALSIGKFRLQGEVHQWMYDDYSLGKLLKEAGFNKIVRRDPITSYIDDWNKFKLDTDADGVVYKPDSLYLEATK